MWTIDVAKAYQLPLGELTPTQVAKLPHKAKMLDFFANPNWESDIKAVGASSSGKVGVLFLYKADAQDKTKTKPAVSPSYAVKLTDAPQRILFAEYVLKNLAKAKIPKSLVVRLDWDQYAKNWSQLASQPMDSGSKLINVLLKTTCHSKTKNDSLRLDTYNKNLGKLTPTSAERPRYAVIMKAFPVATSSSNPFSQAVPNPFTSTADPSKKIAYHMAAWQDVGNWCKEKKLDSTFTLGSVPDKQRSQYFKDADFQELVWNICTTKWILSNQNYMRKAGRVLAACAFLRNGDQLQSKGTAPANISNIFFFLQAYKDEHRIGKENDPVGVIDNDTLATICSHGDLPEIYAREWSLNPKPKSIDESKKNYLRFVLNGGMELIERSTELDIGDTPGAEPTKLIEKFDASYMKSLVRGVVGSGQAKEYALTQELYADDGSLWGAKVSYPSFPDDPTKGGWPTVRDNLKKGFAEVLQELDKKFLKDCLEVFSYLYDKYGFDYNFDWTTLQVTQTYLATAAKIKYDTEKSVTHFEATEYADYAHPTATVWYDEILGKVHKLEERIIEALKFGVDEGLINKRKRTEIIRFLSYLPHQRQGEFLVVEKISGDDKKKQRLRIKVVRLALLVLYTKEIQRWLYRERMLQKGKAQDAVTMAGTPVRNTVTDMKKHIQKVQEGQLFHNLEKLSADQDLSKSIADLGKGTGIKMAPYFPDAWQSAFQ